MSDRFCKCPFAPCEVHGNCKACIAKSRQAGTLCYCLEQISETYGAKLPVEPPPTEIYETEDEMAVRCAAIVKEVLDEKPDALLCFPAGMSVASTCAKLKEMQDAGEIDFSKAKFVALDEWLDLEDESENCSAFLHKHLYDPLGIRPDQLNLFNTHAEDFEAECKRIDEYIFSNGHIDLMLLGVGMNGHLGLNEPGDCFMDYAKVVNLSETTMSVGQKYFKDGMKLSRGITLGVHHIYETKRVILQICGEHKQDIVRKIYTTRPTEDLPATALFLIGGACVIMDKAAAGKAMDVIPQ